MSPGTDCTPMDKAIEDPRLITAPSRSTGVVGDVVGFLLRRPQIPTLIPTDSGEARDEYSRRILQRLPIDVESYSILNIHQIGIDAPVTVVFEELLDWSGESPCWPNHIATVESIDGSRQSIRILAFGSWTRPLRRNSQLLGSNFGLLFRLTELKRQARPDPANFDNARYLLYRCSGGYPIGIFCVYTRSPLAALEEKERTQVFFTVSFNFFGKKPSWLTRGLHNFWRGVHNRVTSNVLNKFKQLCEASFESIERGEIEQGYDDPRRN